MRHFTFRTFINKLKFTWSDLVRNFGFIFFFEVFQSVSGYSPQDTIEMVFNP